MKVVYARHHALHNPAHEVQYGIPIPTYEVPERAETIRRALDADVAFDLVPSTDHGTEPIEAVHDPGLIRYLEIAWPEWRVSGGLQGGATNAPEMFPDTVLHPALREGMGPGREPKSPVGKLGYWCWETMTPIVPGSYTAARAAVDAGLTAADLVLSGEQHAYALVRPPGHHSPRAAFGGYCFFNNAAVAVEHLARETGGRIAVLDVDYHHGNGVQQIFYQRADVLYCSLHADPDHAYPYFTGFPEETGAGAGEGCTLNLPLSAGCTNEQYLDRLEEGLKAIADFDPAMLVVCLGLDTYGQDPICDFALTTDVYHEVGRRVGALEKPVVVCQEGGYFLPQLGQNVRQWLRGLEGRELDLAPSRP